MKKNIGILVSVALISACQTTPTRHLMWPVNTQLQQKLQKQGNKCAPL